MFGHEPERVAIDSKVLAEKREAWVFLPSSYAYGAQRYPVIYVTDANTRAPHTADTARALAEVGRMPEVIVVGVMNTDRTRDLTPPGSSTFLTFFETELLPEIERRYRIAPYRVFAGHSLGGLLALEMLFTRPQLFNAWIAVSPTVDWDGKYALRRARNFVETTPQLDTTLILAVGNEGPDMNGPFEELGALFKKKAPKGFKVQSYYFAEDDHGSVPIPAHYAALRQLFAPWYFAPNRGEDPKAIWPRAVAHAAEMTKRYGFEVRVPELRANNIAYLLLGAKHVPEAIAVFQANVEAYPNSPNVYDSLGEAYERAGDSEKARANYEKAVERARAARDPRLPIFLHSLERVSKKP